MPVCDDLLQVEAEVQMLARWVLDRGEAKDVEKMRLEDDDKSIKIE